jgi:hypothetical protein
MLYCGERTAKMLSSVMARSEPMETPLTQADLKRLLLDEISLLAPPLFEARYRELGSVANSNRAAYLTPRRKPCAAGGGRNDERRRFGDAETCFRCGTKNPDQAFCGACGSPLALNDFISSVVRDQLVQTIRDRDVLEMDSSIKVFTKAWSWMRLIFGIAVALLFFAGFGVFWKERSRYCRCLITIQAKRVNELLEMQRFDEFAEKECAGFTPRTMGDPR